MEEILRIILLLKTSLLWFLDIKCPTLTLSKSHGCFFSIKFHTSTLPLKKQGVFVVLVLNEFCLNLEGKVELTYNQLMTDSQ